MSLNSSLKKKPMSAVATLDLNLSAQHSLQDAKADEKIHAGSGNRMNAVSGAELWAARIGFFAGGFTVASWQQFAQHRVYGLWLPDLSWILLCFFSGYKVTGYFRDNQVN